MAESMGRRAGRHKGNLKELPPRVKEGYSKAAERFDEMMKDWKETKKITIQGD